jgi:transcriptional regulator with XRE-family HTH domain
MYTFGTRMSTTFAALAQAVQKLPLHLVVDILRRPMPRPSQNSAESFGQRMARLRKAAGLTQMQLAQRVGISRRMVAYYEGQSERPPAHALDQLAQVLRVSADQLLGRRPTGEEIHIPFDVRIWRRLRVIEQLSPADRNAVIKYAEALAHGAGQKNKGEAA